ncbi:hypothetical protein V6N13_020318 [Hibiscus sabdariffa]
MSCSIVISFSEVILQMWKPSIPPFASIPHRLALQAAIASNCAALLPTLVGSFIHKTTYREIALQGLWFAFARHGDVVDAFISTKRNIKGRRFDFVRFSKKTDADRAIERLNGFKLFGSKITVSVAKYNTRVAYWRRIRTGQQETECKKGEENGSFRNPGGRMGPGIVKDEDDIGKTSKGERELKGNAVVTENFGEKWKLLEKILIAPRIVKKMSILITTTQPGMIDEVIELEADSSSEVNWNLSPEVDRNIETYENEIALNGDCLGKESNDNGGSLELDSKRHLGVKEPRGCNQGDILGKSPPDIHGENKSSDEDNTVNHGTFDRNMAEVEVCGTKAVESLEGWTKAVESLECELKKDGPGVDTQLEMGENITALHVGVAKDIIGICFNKKDITCLSPETWVSTKSVWKAIIDEQNKSINKTIEERKFSGPVNSDPLFARKEEEALHSDLKSVKQDMSYR